MRRILSSKMEKKVYSMSTTLSSVGAIILCMFFSLPLVAQEGNTKQIEVRDQQQRPITSNARYFKDFDVLKLDSVQSLAMFYTIFKNYQIKNLTALEKQRIDDKLLELVKEIEDSLAKSQKVFLGRISDSSFVQDDIKNLIAQASHDNEILQKQRAEFDSKIQLLYKKLEADITKNIDYDARIDLLTNIKILAGLLVEKEGRFYENQNDYQSVINALKEKFFNKEDLESTLSMSESQRVKEKYIFSQRLFITVSITLLLAILIVTLIYFSSKLKNQKKALELANGEVKRMNENLESLVFQRTRMLEETNNELDTFLYRASHDLRSPVCSIIGLCHLATHFSNNETKDLLDKVVNTTSSMDRMLKKLSTISEINRPINFSEIKVWRVIEEVKQILISRENIQQNVLISRCPEDLTIYSYPNLIEVIVFNLLENALQFTTLKDSPRRRVEINVSNDSENIYFTITDNGIGIERNIQEKIFNMFFKGTIHSKGNGLGLYIVQKAVHVLKGEVRLFSEPGKFTKFVVSIPLEHAPVEKNSHTIPKSARVELV